MMWLNRPEIILLILSKDIKTLMHLCLAAQNI